MRRRSRLPDGISDYKMLVDDGYTPSLKDFQSIGYQNPYMLAFDIRFSENIKVTEYISISTRQNI